MDELFNINKNDHTVQSIKITKSIDGEFFCTAFCSKDGKYIDSITAKYYDTPEKAKQGLFELLIKIL